MQQFPLSRPWGPCLQLDAVYKELQLGGPAQDLSNFQMAPIPILSVLTCSTSSLHDILKVLLKKIDQNLPAGRVEHDIVDRVGLALGIRLDLD